MTVRRRDRAGPSLSLPRAEGGTQAKRSHGGRARGGAAGGRGGRAAGHCGGGAHGGRQGAPVTRALPRASAYSLSIPSLSFPFVSTLHSFLSFFHRRAVAARGRARLRAPGRGPRGRRRVGRADCRRGRERRRDADVPGLGGHDQPGASEHFISFRIWLSFHFFLFPGRRRAGDESEWRVTLFRACELSPPSLLVRRSVALSLFPSLPL